MRGEMAPHNLPSRSATPANEVYRRVPATPRARGKESNSRNHTCTRTKLWPPSHVEVMASIDEEDYNRGRTIPSWCRGPLLLQQSKRGHSTTPSGTTGGIGVGCAHHGDNIATMSQDPSLFDNMQELWERRREAARAATGDRGITRM
ncbi:unnamed protein product, partial [Ascophyllum nodosum]